MGGPIVAALPLKSRICWVDSDWFSLSEEKDAAGDGDSDRALSDLRFGGCRVDTLGSDSSPSSGDGLLANRAILSIEKSDSIRGR